MNIHDAARLTMMRLNLPVVEVPSVDEHRAVNADLVDTVRRVIVARRQECYGALAISNAQVEELARAIIANLRGDFDLERIK